MVGFDVHFNYVINKTLLSPHSPEFGMLVMPILSYWLVASFYDMLDVLDPPFVRRFRIVRKVTTGPANVVSKSDVVLRVLSQHMIQFALALFVLYIDPEQCAANPAKGWAMSCFQFLLGMLVMDTWQFWIHRWAHVNTFLYKHMHSHHHRLTVPYAYGALYNHPMEALLLDTLGGVVTLYASGMSCEVGSWFMNFATIKTVLDHSGYIFPVNPLHDAFPNGAAYHDVHHDFRYIKKNYSQPFFTHWDWIMGSLHTSNGFHLTPDEAASSHASSASSSRRGSRDGGAIDSSADGSAAIAKKGAQRRSSTKPSR